MTQTLPYPARLPQTKPATGRHISVDVLRGFVMLTMIFVNDVAGVPAAPWWMHHYKPYDANGMTFVDAVFPAFLFVVGLSLPLALENRRKKGAATRQLLRHVIERTLSLLLIGVFMVNMHGWDVWSSLALLASMAAFLSAPRWPKNLVMFIRTAGFIALIGLWWSYPKVYDGAAMHTAWWGILGLIGWAYLVAALVYLLARGSRVGLVAGMGLCLALYYADYTHAYRSLLSGWWLPEKINLLAWVRGYVGFGSQLGSHASITLAGAILGTCLLPDAPEKTDGQKLRFALWLTIPLLLGAILTYPSFGINKEHATPAWCLLCSAITTLLFIFFYWATEMTGKTKWAWLLAGCGANALLAYLSQSLFYRALSLMHLPWHGIIGKVPMGIDIAQSLFCALLLATVAALLNKGSIRLKL